MNTCPCINITSPWLEPPALLLNPLCCICSHWTQTGSHNQYVIVTAPQWPLSIHVLCFAQAHLIIGCTMSHRAKTSRHSWFCQTCNRIRKDACRWDAVIIPSLSAPSLLFCYFLYSLSGKEDQSQVKQRWVVWLRYTSLHVVSKSSWSLISSVSLSSLCQGFTLVSVLTVSDWFILSYRSLVQHSGETADGPSLNLCQV